MEQSTTPHEGRENNHYTRESAFERLDNLLSSEEGTIVDSALSVVGLDTEQVKNCLEDKDLLPDSEVESFVKELAVLVSDFKHAGLGKKGNEYQKEKRESANALAKLLSKKFSI